MMVLFVSIFFSLSFLNYVGFEFLLDEMSINMNILGHVVRDCNINDRQPNYHRNHALAIRYSHFDWAQITGLTHGLAHIDIGFIFN